MPRPADPNARESLIAAARAEFARRGLKAARIEDITAACGLSKGAFYLHFPSKEALFGELVEGFAGDVLRAAEERRVESEAFLSQHGYPSREDIEARSPLYRSFAGMEMRHDLFVLERMWVNRDVVGVLVRGCQGTQFEGAIWSMADAEIDRCKRQFEQFQKLKACRTDIPAEIFGSLIVGTYVLLGVRMSQMAEKPDLAEWARSLQSLIREGSSVRETVPPATGARSSVSRSHS